MNKKSFKIDFTFHNFEEISEVDGNKILGGFSSSIGGTETIAPEDAAANNCNGGNCVSECGSGQNIQCNSNSSGCSK